MNKYLINTTLLLFLLLLMICTGCAGICGISGTVINRDSKIIYLVKTSDTSGTNRLALPIRDHQFHTSFLVREPFQYQLIFEEDINKPQTHPIVFYAVGAVIKFKLYPDNQAEKNEIKGGKRKMELAAKHIKQNI